MTTTLQREPVLVLPAGASRAEWLAARRRGIGGSDVAAILGLDTWASPYSVWAEKTGQVIDEAESEAMRWGTLLEPVVRDEWSQRTGLAVAPSPGVLAHPERAWQLVNVDGLVGDHGIFEGKTTTEWKSDDWAHGKVPDRTMLQVQHGLTVTGRSEAHIAALVGGNRLVTASVQRDDELIAMLTDAEASFWHRVTTRTPPAVDGHPATTETLGLLHGVEPGKIRVLDPGQVIPLLTARREAKAAVKAAEAAVDLADNGLKALLGECEAGVIDDDVAVTWKHRPAVIVAAFERKAGRTLLVKKAWTS